MKAIYSYDQKSFDYLGARLEPDDYNLVVGETLITPPSNLTKLKFNVVTQKWTGEKINPSLDARQQILMQQAQIALQQASFQAEQQKLNSQLALQLAQLTAKESKQNV